MTTGMDNTKNTASLTELARDFIEARERLYPFPEEVATQFAKAFAAAMNAHSPVNTAQPAGSVQAFRDAIRKRWSFDEGQQHTHSWHDREDFIELELPKLLAALTQPVSAPSLTAEEAAREVQDTCIEITGTKEHPVTAMNWGRAAAIIQRAIDGAVKYHVEQSLQDAGEAVMAKAERDAANKRADELQKAVKKAIKRYQTPEGAGGMNTLQIFRDLAASAGLPDPFIAMEEPTIAQFPALSPNGEGGK